MQATVVHAGGVRGAEAGRQVFAVVLAAGSSHRYGSPKQLALHRGQPLVARALAIAEEACGPRSLLVAGHEWQAVVRACLPMRGCFVRFEGYAEGIGASIACAARCVDDAAEAMLLVLADQPLVTAGHLAALSEAWRRSPGSIVATSYAGVAGPPVVFPRRCFGPLARLGGDRGARGLLERPDERVLTVPFEPAAVDVDRPEDLARLRDAD